MLESLTPEELTDAAAEAEAHRPISDPRIKELLLRPFDEKEFSLPLDPELIKELEWQEDMAKATLEMYGWIDR